MSNPNGYEIRLEILQLANDILKNTATKVSDTQKEYTVDNVITTAQALNSFVTERGR